MFGFVCVFAATYDCTTVRLGQHTLEKEINLKSFSLIKVKFRENVMTDWAVSSLNHKVFDYMSL